MQKSLAWPSRPIQTNCYVWGGWEQMRVLYPVQVCWLTAVVRHGRSVAAPALPALASSMLTLLNPCGRARKIVLPVADDGV